MKKNQKFLIAMAAYIAIIYLFTQALIAYAQLPTVNWSHGLDACVSVIDFQGKEIPNGCDAIPPWHHRIVVK